MFRIEAALSRRSDAAFTISFGAATLVFLGEYARAEEWAARAISLDPESYIVRYNAGCTYAVIGKPHAALEALEYIFAHMPRARRWLLGMISHDTQIQSLGERSDFQAFVKRLEADVATQS
jgi:adenylate cyclase